MNNRKKSDPKGAVIVFVIAIAAAMFGAVEDGNYIVPAVVLGIAVVVACVSAASKKKKTEDKTLKRMSEHEVKTPAFSAQSDTAEALRCTCAHGKQRYLDQAAMFYKNGLIDRAEYNAMCERYNKLELPEGM